MEEIFTVELKKSDEKITKLSEDFNSLQVSLPIHSFLSTIFLTFSHFSIYFHPTLFARIQLKLRDGFDDKSTMMSHHIDVKTEELKGEMKFLMGMIGLVSYKHVLLCSHRKMV